MNATDFGHLSDRDHTRGICMWVWDKEWCAKPLVCENYRGSFNTPANNNTWGQLYGIHVPDGMPEYDSMWICHKHRPDFLKLNSKGNLGVTIWEIQYTGMGIDVTRPPKLDVRVQVSTTMDEMSMSNVMKALLIGEMRENDDITGWDNIEVTVASGLTSGSVTS